MGPVTTQVMVASVVPNSSAMRWIDTARIVMVTFTANRPNSTVARIRQPPGVDLRGRRRAARVQPFPGGYLTRGSSPPSDHRSGWVNP
jgi:hypothetical protein